MRNRDRIGRRSLVIERVLLPCHRVTAYGYLGRPPGHHPAGRALGRVQRHPHVLHDPARRFVRDQHARGDAAWQRPGRHGTAAVQVDNRRRHVHRNAELAPGVRGPTPCMAATMGPSVAMLYSLLVSVKSNGGSQH